MRFTLCGLNPYFSIIMSQVLVASPTSPPMTIAFKSPAQHLPSPTQVVVEDVPPEERILVSQVRLFRRIYFLQLQLNSHFQPVVSFGQSAPHVRV